MGVDVKTLDVRKRTDYDEQPNGGLIYRQISLLEESSFEGGTKQMSGVKSKSLGL
jgi:hypothetical protein